MRNLTTWLGSAACVWLLGASVAVAQNVPDGLTRFVDELLQKHAYMLSDQERSELDRINRELREAEHQWRNADNDNDKAAAKQRMLSVSNQFVEQADSSAHVTHIALVDGRVKPSIRGPWEFPSDRGALIFRVDCGEEGPLRFITQDIDWSERSWGIQLDVGPRGVTYVLLGMNHLPQHNTIITTEFRRKDMPMIPTLLEVSTPDYGRLRLTVLSDDSGKPTSAMVRMVSRRDGRDRRPDNAIDLAPQFDNQGRASGHRNTNLPGRLGGEWWVVPEPFDMELPPGQYDISIRHGMEHIPVFDTITVTSNETTEKTYRPKRWVDMRHAGWYSGDDHVHCRILSDDDAERLMAWVQAEDIHIANIVKMGDIYRTWFEQRGFGEAYRVVDRDYVLSPGQECPRTHDQLGHTLSMNTTSMVRDVDKYYLYDWVADTVHNQGGLFGFAHVNSGIFHVHRGMSLFIPRMKCDFVELLQFNKMDPGLYYEFLNLGFKVTASAGSDVPWGGSVGEVRLYAFLGDQPFDVGAWFEAVREGHTFVTSGPMVEFTVDDALPGDELSVEKGQKVRVRARAWGHPDRGAPEKLEIVRLGEVIHTATPDGNRPNEASADLTLDVDGGFWIAARVSAANGTKAHTTPVYVIRDGLRCWKYDAVKELLALRHESLQQVRDQVTEAQRKYATGELHADQPWKELAEQGDELLKRVDMAEAIYDKLAETAAREADLRK